MLKVSDHTITQGETQPMPQTAVESDSLLESLDGVLESAPSRNFIVPQGECNTHMGNNSVTWRNCLPWLWLWHGQWFKTGWSAYFKKLLIFPFTVASLCVCFSIFQLLLRHTNHPALGRLTVTLWSLNRNLSNWPWGRWSAPTIP